MDTMRKMILFLALAACTKGDANNAAAAADPDAQLMTRGLAELQGGDPATAERTFRELLAKNPNHYGGHYQLAVSLDRGGKPADARREWEYVKNAAQSANDSATLRSATARLASPDTASQEAMMARGLDLLYKGNDPAGAADEFRKVLRKNATHYGATYQLATALDRAGQRAAAKPYWEKALGMAIGFKDEKTAAVARERLK
jgi:Tfp pilus assembly protein PilF